MPPAASARDPEANPSQCVRPGARKDVEPPSVHLFSARALKVGGYGGDLAVRDGEVGLRRPLGSNEGAALDDQVIGAH